LFELEQPAQAIRPTNGKSLRNRRTPCHYAVLGASASIEKVRRSISRAGWTGAERFRV
jgi:hypothetical protein